MTSQTGFSTGLIVLAVGASLLATPAQAQKAGTTYRLGWLEFAVRARNKTAKALGLTCRPRCSPAPTR